MRYGLIGGKLGHSYSREIHGLAGGYDYELREIAPEELAAFLEKRDFLGINVTIPYKQAVMPYLDEIDALAREIGAVNTIVNRGGKLIGYNTDFTGLRNLILHNGIVLSGRKVLILGSGGTSRTARAVARALGASAAVIAGRTEKPGVVSYEEAVSVHCDASVIINTTPCGMYPDVLSAPVSLEPFTRLEALVDVVYNPLRTRLVMEAQRRGVRSCNGLYMLASQGVAASALFLDVPMDEEKALSVYRQLYRQKRNIVLAGMPGSGKTTTGKILAGRLGMAFADTDELIQKKTGRHPAQIIREDGEEAFRGIESAVVREISSASNTVVSTGGGVILKDENMSCLKGNGKVFFIDRDIQDIVPYSDRPLSDTREKLEETYRRRYPLYCSTCDFRIKAGASCEETADLIMEAADEV